MKKALLAGCAGLLAGHSAWAGGLDRSGQDISIIFEDGSYSQLSYANVDPTVTGNVAGVVDSGDMAPRYSRVMLGHKSEVGPNTDIAIIVDQPFGADVDYPTGTGYPLAGTNAAVTTRAITVVGQHGFGNGFSVLGGVRTQSVDGEIFITGGYTLDITDTGAIGYLAGVAYEIPDIFLRVSAIWNSGIEHTLTGTELGGPVEFDIKTPQSLNINARTGVPGGFLVFGSVRWADWDAFDISPPAYVFLNGTPLVSYDEDIVTYTIGAAKPITDNFLASVAIGYEETQGNPVSNLSPTDGFTSIQVGGRYTHDNIQVSGGISYVMIGDATSKPPVGGDFADNSAIGVGLSVGITH